MSSSRATRGITPVSILAFDPDVIDTTRTVNTQTNHCQTQNNQVRKMDRKQRYDTRSDTNATQRTRDEPSMTKMTELTTKLNGKKIITTPKPATTARPTHSTHSGPREASLVTLLFLNNTNEASEREGEGTVKGKEGRGQDDAILYQSRLYILTSKTYTPDTRVKYMYVHIRLTCSDDDVRDKSQKSVVGKSASNSLLK